MIRITRPDGTVYECETEREFQIVQRSLVNGHVPGRSVPQQSAGPSVSSTAPQTLEEGPRKVLTALLGSPQIDGQELRQRVGMTSQELGRTMLLLSNSLQQVTSKRLDEYVTRQRTFKNGQRIKVYKRTRAGEKLLRETQIV